MRNIYIYKDFIDHRDFFLSSQRVLLFLGKL